MNDRSVHAGDVRQSVVVTGDGNSVRLVFGDSGKFLPLRRLQFPPPQRHRRTRDDHRRRRQFVERRGR